MADYVPDVSFCKQKSGTLTVTRIQRLPCGTYTCSKKIALCTNWNDSAERRAEVEQIGKIFSRASQVVIWLGPES